MIEIEIEEDEEIEEIIVGLDDPVFFFYTKVTNLFSFKILKLKKKTFNLPFEILNTF